MPNEYPMPDLEKLILSGPTLTDRLKNQPTVKPHTPNGGIIRPQPSHCHQSIGATLFTNQALSRAVSLAPTFKP
jgi:hypothetical protein